MNRRFPLLSIISVLMRVIGWLYLVPGLLFWLVIIVLYFTNSGAELRRPVDIGAGAFLTAFGLLLVAAGESIGVFFAIEDNTRAAAEHLYKLASEKITPKT